MRKRERRCTRASIDMYGGCYGDKETEWRQLWQLQASVDQRRQGEKKETKVFPLSLSLVYYYSFFFFIFISLFFFSPGPLLSRHGHLLASGGSSSHTHAKLSCVDVCSMLHCTKGWGPCSPSRLGLQTRELLKRREFYHHYHRIEKASCFLPSIGSKRGSRGVLGGELVSHLYLSIHLVWIDLYVYIYLRWLT